MEEVRREETAETHNEIAQSQEETLQELIIDYGKVVHVVPLCVKPPQIVDWVMAEERGIHVYKFIRADKGTLSCGSF